MKDKIFYKRNLPHYHPLNASFFITFRLANSLPWNIFKDLKAEFESKKRKLNKNPELFETELYKLNIRYFGKFDSLLDSSIQGHNWLKNEKIAKLVSDELLRLDKTNYDMLAFSIMPNHVHLVFSTFDDARLESRVTDNTVTRDLSRDNLCTLTKVTQILRKIKGVTARESNKILRRQGQFWHHESYDHVVRDEKELTRIINYVLNNPVKAGFVENWYDWKWNYLKSD